MTTKLTDEALRKKQVENMKKWEQEDFNFYAEFISEVTPNKWPSGLSKPFKDLSEEEKTESFKKFKKDIEKI